MFLVVSPKNISRVWCSASGRDGNYRREIDARGLTRESAIYAVRGEIRELTGLKVVPILSLEI